MAKSRGPGAEIIRGINQQKKADRIARVKAWFKPFTDSIQHAWRTGQIILVVILGLSVIATGIGGIYAGLNLVHGPWVYIVTVCGAFTVSTGLVEMFKSVEKVS